MRYRTETRTREVTHTVDGQTEIIDEPYEIHIPVPPRDWDQIIRHAVLAVAALILTASLVWSTASIGGLLTLLVIEPAAYAAAVVFDLVWMACMALEWLARYDPQRAALPRNAGHLALAVAMIAVAAHGSVQGQRTIGIVGAVVSALAKGLWTIMLRQMTPPLDARTQAWVTARRARVGAQLGMISVQRDLTRAQSQVDAERAALQASPDADPDRPDQSADDPDADVLDLAAHAESTKDAVRIAWDAGLRDRDAVTRCVGKATGRAVSPDTVDRYLRALKVGA
ncbi:protein transporter Sec31 [Streptomyces sp. NPDC050504]|uniref:protein transporter Sec31 n=1 Tax=Streptomyces sp. NPDC050504 TaxID=3365618 RepID=UPI0037AF57AB